MFIVPVPTAKEASGARKAETRQGSTAQTVGTLIVFSVLCLMVFLWVRACEPDRSRRRGSSSASSGAPSRDVEYRITDRQSYDLGRLVGPGRTERIPRTGLRVKLPQQYRRDELERLSNYIIDGQGLRSQAAVSIVYYVGEDSGLNVVATADWAPNGNWADAMTSAPKRLIVQMQKPIR